jgi:hypothetical protein
MNSGSDTWPTEAIGAANPFAGVNVGASSPVNVNALTFADVNGDGALDLVVGSSIDGTITVWLNSGSDTWPIVPSANPFDGVNVGSCAALTVADVNGDGALDLVVASSDGTIKVRLNSNSGSDTWPTEALGAANPFDGVNVGGSAAPTFADVNGDGALDLVVHGSGIIRVWHKGAPEKLCRTLPACASCYEYGLALTIPPFFVLPRTRRLVHRPWIPIWASDSVHRDVCRPVRRPERRRRRQSTMQLLARLHR